MTAPNEHSLFNVECKHELMLDECTLCNGKGRDTYIPDDSDGIRFIAKYEGHCKECNFPINIGDRVSWVSNRIMRNMIVIHAGCADAWNAPRTRR